MKYSYSNYKVSDLTGSFPLNQRISGNVSPVTRHVKSTLSPGETRTCALSVDTIGGSVKIYIHTILNRKIIIIPA